MNGQCGNATKHCLCTFCTDYKMLKDWRDSNGTQMWRYDGRCGSENPLPDGTPAECHPDGEKPCCSIRGKCGNTKMHCSCKGCKDFKHMKDWRESGGKLRWRYDGRCGENYRLPDGKHAECDPNGESPCCNRRLDGRCGNTTEHCLCKTCTDFSIIHREWRESKGEKKWRYDGRCGRDNPLSNGKAAQCDPNGENPCCNRRYNGKCGNTTSHCSCRFCKDFKFIREWKEADGKIRWRPDGRCGKYYLLPDGTPSECDPDGENPCCNHEVDGRCGNSAEHCSCDHCTDYEYIKESVGKPNIRIDRKCGWNGNPGECDPLGKYPCCDMRQINISSNPYPMYAEKCGNRPEQCNCTFCIDYRDTYKDWLESRGNNKWRNDGKCGDVPYHKTNNLPDGSIAECNPDGDRPCCAHVYCSSGSYSADHRRESEHRKKRSSTNLFGEENCLCDGCIDYRLVRDIRESGKNCTIARIGTGFLKYVCFDGTRQYYKCINSDEHYKMTKTTWHQMSWKGSTVCKNDPYVYQACGFRTQITNADVLCGGYMCQNSGYYIECEANVCKVENRDPDCQPGNTNFDEIESKLICNDKCDMDNYNCEDEKNCNGYNYDSSCYGWTRDWAFVCHGYKLCVDGITENITNCTDAKSISDHTCSHNINSHISYNLGILVPILNFTRCSVFDVDRRDRYDRENPIYPYCQNYLDQTNCSDIERVGGYCEVNGFMASVSKYMVCYKNDKLPVILCDDGFQNQCLFPSSSSCEVHKHKMCNGIGDCFDRGDEVHDICAIMSDYFNFTCLRRFDPKKIKTNIPLSWIMDNQTDCLDGEDEDSTRWEAHFCPGTFRQILLPGKVCLDVFKCPGRANSFVPLDRLCDEVESCVDGTENEVCKIARDFPTIERTVLHNDSIRNLCNSSADDICKLMEFTRPWGSAFGEPTIEFLVPSTKVNCSERFGEAYLFLSCMSLCLEENATCPLDGTNRILQYDSCPGQYSERAYTLGNDSFLTFVVDSDNHEYHQDFYRCNNGRCVDYSQVCDLVDDCGDMSDEMNCVNHMICEDTLNSSRHQFISLSQKCDGIYDCFDLSDECNNNCGRKILQNWVLKVICWFMGILALIFNFSTVVNGAAALKRCETEKMMTSLVFMALIGSGDLLIGLYLVILSVYDSFIFGNEFCRHQAEWLTGTPCITLGIISTLGSQLSLFTMTFLSIIRMYGLTCKPMRVPEPVSRKSILRVAFQGVMIFAVALAVAVIPLVPSFAEYFVQGMYYDDQSYKLFIGFPNKDRHIKILQAYYDRNKTENATSIFSNISWTEIGEKVDAMFSRDYGNITRSPVHFYGNDGVCLFKYFVRTDDARRSRQSTNEVKAVDPVVWSMLTVNLICFIVITCCYMVITIQTKKSSKSSGQQNNKDRQREERAIQNKIMLIIATDFLCWVPFIIISALHNLEYMDASQWYASFAMTVLPLNSVINPLVYDKTLMELISRALENLKVYVGAVTTLTTTAMAGLLGKGRRPGPEVVELGWISKDGADDPLRKETPKDTELVDIKEICEDI